jgi:hypothetical protein
MMPPCIRGFSILSGMLVCLIVVSMTVESFTAQQQQQQSPQRPCGTTTTSIRGRGTTTTTTTHLALVPDHGKQLVAASAFAYKSQPPTGVPENNDDQQHNDDDDDDWDHHRDSTTNEPPARGAATRSFLSRVFSLPVALLWSYPTVSDSQQHQEQHEMVFPLVGFRRVYLPELGEGRWLPTTTSRHASCRLPPPTTQEPLVGWYSRPPVARRLVSSTNDTVDDNGLYDPAQRRDDLL